MCVHPDFSTAQAVGETAVFIADAYGGHPELIGLALGQTEWVSNPDDEWDGSYQTVLNKDSWGDPTNGFARLNVEGMTALRDELNRRLALVA